MQLIDMTLAQAARELSSGRVSSSELTKACLDQIERTQNLNNYITVTGELALAEAKRQDELRKNGKAPSPIAGIPIAVKDNIVTKGIKTTCASRFLENFVPPYDSYVAAKLKAAGCVILGKTNMDEFAMGSSNENSAFGAVKNVLDNTRVPGGSSGGSANCVAAKTAFAALGSDTGGSIRQPAAYCGVVGLKPTYSAVSRNGLIAFASSLDQIGTLTRDCDDAAIMYNLIIGKDEMDSTNVQAPRIGELHADVKGKVLGVAKEFLDADLDSGVKERFNAALGMLEKSGAKIEYVSIKSFDAALAVYYVLSSAEAASNLARFDGVKYGARASDYNGISELYTASRTQYFGAEVKRRILTGNYVLSSGYYDAYYLKASKIRTVIKREFDEALKKCDAILSPTAPLIAPSIGRKISPSDHYLSDIYTVPVNIAGLPGVSVPYGTVHGMPVGVQVVGRAFDESGILSIGKAIQTEGNHA